MLRAVSILLVLGLSVGSSAWILAQDSGAGSLKKPLDLPSGGLGDDDEEEDAPEIINFYGSEYEGDAFFWCLDRSCSMGWNGGAPLATLKQEMTQAINSLSDRAELGVVAFHTSHTVWQQLPQRATPTAKSSAISWIQALTAIGTTCIQTPAIQTLNIANLSSKQSRRMILVGDGVPECPPPNSPEQNEQVLSEITAANYQNVPIDTVFISASEIGIALFQQIAASNGGTFSNPQ